VSDAATLVVVGRAGYVAAFIAYFAALVIAAIAARLLGFDRHRQS
jgi:hypothetical protein